MENNINTNGEFTVLSDELTNDTQPPATEEKPEVTEKPVGFWTYIGLFLLFAIPVVGFIAAIVFIFAPKRKGLKNFAGAAVTYIATNLIVTLLVVSVILTAIGNAFVPAINESLGTEFETITEVFDIAKAMMNGDYSSLIEHFKPQLLETLGQEYKALLDELTKQDYNQMISQLLNEDYATLLEDLKSGKYPSLEEVLGEKEFNSFVSEVEIAANGEASEFLGGLSSFIPPEIQGFLK